jgi:hypothetical protein
MIEHSSYDAVAPGMQNDLDQRISSGFIDYPSSVGLDETVFKFEAAG